LESRYRSEIRVDLKVGYNRFFSLQKSSFAFLTSHFRSCDRQLYISRSPCETKVLAMALLWYIRLSWAEIWYQKKDPCGKCL